MRPSIRIPQLPSPATPLSRVFLLLLPLLAFFAALTIVHNGTLHAQTPEPVSAEGAIEETIEGNTEETTEVTYSESEAQGIDRMIMCPVCPAETIDQAQVEISRQMRQIVRDMLAQGSERDDILDFFVERYGNDILAAPPKSGANLVAWLLPVAGVFAALIAVFFIIRSMTHRGPVLAVPQAVSDPGLIPYLQLVDRHLDMTRGGARPSDTSNQPGPSVQSRGESPEDTNNPSAEVSN